MTSYISHVRVCVCVLCIFCFVFLIVLCGGMCVLGGAGLCFVGVGLFGLGWVFLRFLRALTET